MRTTSGNRSFCSAFALVLATLGTGCVTQEQRNAAYEKALSQWQGASEETLLARWGKPMAEQASGNGKWLTYVVNNGVAPTSTVSFGFGGYGYGGGNTSMGAGVGVTAPVGTPSAMICTTRFLVENGKVTTWNFDGQGCGVTG
jgi:hypothetical protein